MKTQIKKKNNLINRILFVIVFCIVIVFWRSVFAQDNIFYNYLDESDYSINILNDQIEIGTIWVKSNLDFFMWDIEEAKNIVNSDPMFLLDKTMTFENNFYLFLDKVKDVLFMLQNDISYINYSMSDFKYDEMSCWSDREFYEEEFFYNIQNNNPNLDYYLDAVIKNEQCASYNRIKYNAYESIYDEMSFYYEALNRKYEYWDSNRLEIIENRDFYYNA